MRMDVTRNRQDMMTSSTGNFSRVTGHLCEEFTGEFPALRPVTRIFGVFIGGSRTWDSIFILQGLVQRQMIIGDSLFVCFIDFSKAFDLVSRHILFYKIMKGGWTGRVIDTLRSPYSKTHYRVKRDGKLSPMIPSLAGVNQGGAASGIPLRKYLQDLDKYLNKDAGVCFEETLVPYLLWADDPLLFSNT